MVHGKVHSTVRVSNGVAKGFHQNISQEISTLFTRPLQRSTEEFVSTLDKTEIGTLLVDEDVSQETGTHQELFNKFHVHQCQAQTEICLSPNIHLTFT